MKLLDYQGLSHFWDNIDDIKQDKLTIDKELDATSHNPVENMAIKFEIDQLLERIDDGDDVNTYLYELYKGVIPYTGQGTDPGNTYTSTIYCLVHGLVATIYFDIIGNYGAQQFNIVNKIPEGCTPFKGITHIVAQSQSEFNNISIGTDGQIIITSNNNNFDTHCAITYLIKPSSIDPDYPDPLPSEEAQYTTSARLVKIGNYFPVVSGNTIGGQTMRGAALMTDVSGSEFSGYEGGYTVYLTNGQNTIPGTEQFYWNKKCENDIIIDGNIEKGKLFSFADCFEAASGAITEDDLIEKGIDMVEALAENTETIQYFVTGFGKNAWVGGVNSAYNSQIKEKAYGGTAGAGDYNGRFYWQNAILAHVFRYVPASGEQYIVDKSHPVEKDNVVIGYIDKIIPLKLIDTAYNWANFNIANGSTWRAPKLISTQETLATLHDTFEAQLVFEDWNNPSTTGNKFGNLSNYYQRIDAKLTETQTESGGGYPDWWTIPIQNSYNNAMNNFVNTYSTNNPEIVSEYFMNQYIDIASLDYNNKVYVERIFRKNNNTSQATCIENINPQEGQDLVITFENNYQTEVHDVQELVIGMYYDSSTGQWSQDEFQGYVDDTQSTQDIEYTANEASIPLYLDMITTFYWSEYMPILAKKVNNVLQRFVCGSTVEYNLPDIAAGSPPIIDTSIEQEYVQVRTGKNWAKTSNRLQTYTGSEFN